MEFRQTCCAIKRELISCVERKQNFVKTNLDDWSDFVEIEHREETVNTSSHSVIQLYRPIVLLRNNTLKNIECPITGDKILDSYI